LRAGLIGGLCSLFLVLLAGQALATPCDLDQDGDVDLDDITQLQWILPSRPTASGPDDPRDPDRNGRIDILDARVCVLRCTLPRCARVSPTPPTVSLTAPVADARYLAPATITLAADASGAAPVTRVEFLADATVIATVGNSPYTADWANVAAGTYQLSARATDRIGSATTSAARRILVDSHNTPPTVSLTAPLDGAAYPLSATVTLTATASDVELNTPVSRVDFYHGPTLIGGSTTAPYQLAWTPPAAGVYRLTARATDSAGAMTTSAAHELTVQGNLPPTVSLTSPGANERFTAPATVTLTADANDADGVARVDFFHGATLIGSAASSPYRVVWNPVAAGSYLLTAQATDRLGASQSSAAVPITVNAPASAGLTILYLHADHLGTPRVATDDSQTVVWRNPPTSEPFGMALPEEDPDGDGRLTTINLRFPGQYFDQETQAHYNYFRDHYFPELGRYGQSDPIGLAGGVNTYSYVGGNPLGMVDPAGLFGLSDFVGNYFSSDPRPVDLGSVGLLGDFQNSSSVTSLTSGFREQTAGAAAAADKARIMCANCDQGTRKANFSFSENKDNRPTSNVTWESAALFNVGKSSFFRSAQCMVVANCKTRRFMYSCGLSFSIKDKFSDPIDIGAELPGGSPYPITASWVAHAGGSGGF
jgi:RHS repeat-associated protein